MESRQHTRNRTDENACLWKPTHQVLGFSLDRRSSQCPESQDRRLAIRPHLVFLTAEHSWAAERKILVAKTGRRELPDKVRRTDGALAKSGMSCCVSGIGQCSAWWGWVGPAVSFATGDACPDCSPVDALRNVGGCQPQGEPEARFYKGGDSDCMIPQGTLTRGAVGTIVLIVPENGFEPGFVHRGWFVLLPVTICTPFF